MGKTQRVREKKRQNMTGVPSVASMDAAALANEPLVAEEPRVPLLTKIDDPVALHRVQAFQALSSLVIDDPETKQALSNKANLKKIIAHVCDPDLDARVAAIGTLRNMTQFGDQQVSNELVKNDVLTPLLATTQQTVANPGANKDAVNQLLCQSIALLMNLCENSDKASELCSMGTNLVFFAQFLQPKIYSYDLVVTTGQFFFVLTDNNSRAQQELSSIPGYLEASKSLIQDLTIPVRVRTLLAGIDANLFASSDAFNGHTHVWNLVFQNLNCDWNVETQNLFARLGAMDGEVVVRAVHSTEAIIVDEMPTEQEKLERKKEKEKKEEDDEKEEVMEDEEAAAAPKAEEDSHTKEEIKKLQHELEIFQENIKAQKLALEILTNICTDEYEEKPNESMDDDMDNDNEEGEYDENPASAATPADTAPTARSPLIWSSGLFPRVLQIAYPSQPLQLQNRILEGSEWVHETFLYLREVQERAVACLGNMLLEPGAKSNIADPRKVWDALVTICAQSEKNIPVLESATNGMWTLLRLFNTSGSSLLVPSTENIAGIIRLAQSGDEFANLRSTAIGMLGVIAQNPQLKSSLMDIGRLFLESLISANPTVIAEALNSIFDVFAEKTHNDIVGALNMITILRNFLPHLKNKLKNEKRQMGRDVWDRLDESRVNLVRFLKYKKTH